MAVRADAVGDREGTRRYSSGLVLAAQRYIQGDAASTPHVIAPT